MDSGPARFFAPYAHVVFDFWEEYVEISLLDDLGGEVKRSGEMSVVIPTHSAWLRRAAVAHRRHRLGGVGMADVRALLQQQDEEEEEKSFVTACNRTRSAPSLQCALSKKGRSIVFLAEIRYPPHLLLGTRASLGMAEYNDDAH